MMPGFAFFVISALFHTASTYLNIDDYKGLHYNNADAELFLNYGHKKLKDDKHENSVLKSKVEVLGEILKKHVELLRNTPNQRIELVFLVDSSASVGAENFFNELKFVKKLLADFTVSYEATRVSVVTFSSKNRVVRHIDHITNANLTNHKCKLLEEEIPAIGYTGGGTYTLGAVLEAQKILNYARQDAKKAVFLITDGYSNGGDPRPAARRLRDQGVEMFTFGIRNGNVRELFDMASEPQHEHSYIVDSFEEFEALARRALHEDLPSGGYLNQDRSSCLSICNGAKFDKWSVGSCCDSQASCACGTHSGLYACLCQPGYFGTGLFGDCHECPSGTYKNFSGPGDISSCTPCPSKNHISPPGSTSPDQCVCKPGYFLEKNMCRVSTCPNLQPPENGYFIKNSCSSILNAACGFKCNIGYTLVGSHIRMCQEDGSWSGNETKCIIKRCPEVKPPKHGFINCTNPDPVFDSECEFSCDDGYMLVGSKKRTCLPISVWTGVAAFCRPIQCQPFRQLVNGTISPARCTEAKNKFGDICEISCKPGYELRGSSVKTCGERGKWSDDTTPTKCIDVSPPVFTCPKDLDTTTELDENFAVVTWEVPVIHENSGVPPYLTSIPAVEPPMRFRIGVSQVTYTATDSAGNKAECTFEITVKDTQPPTVDRCDSPPTFLSRDRKVPLVFEEPLFSDNSGKAVRVTKSYDTNIFPLGETVVTYTAYDESGNSASCNITVKVQEHACQLPPDPIHGSKNCTAKPDAVYCTLTCIDGYAFASRPPQDYFCNYDGVWKPNDNPLPFPDCSVTAHSNAVIQDGTMKIDAAPDFCNDPFLLTQVEHHVRHKMMDKMTEICGDSVVCELESLQAACSDLDLYSPMDDENSLDNGISPLRRKREIETTTIADVEVNSTAEIQVNFTVKSTVEANASIPAMQKLESLESGLKQAVVNGAMDLELGGKKLPVDHITFAGEQKVLCEPGSIPQGDMCVLCPVGTHYNVITEVCEACPQGTFQSEEGKLACMVCPENTSTKTGSAKVAGDCKAQCLPGTMSPDGLEPCSTCPVGSWQIEYAQKVCNQCPSGMTTWRRGSRRATECRESCKPGEVSETGLVPCFPCPIGYYQPEGGQTFCLGCTTGMTTDSVGASNQSSCIEEIAVNEIESLPATNESVILEVNDCFSDPCQNEATCKPMEFGYVCFCLAGFTGMNCDINIDECSSSPCGNNGTCVDNIDGFSCLCPFGFSGTFCEIDIDDCLENPCQNSGTCFDKVGDFLCECRPGFTGTYCETDIDDCQDSPCFNGGTCVDGENKYTCACEPGFVGLHCEENYDECSHEPCMNGGACVDDVNMYRCDCLVGFSGENCEHETDECESKPCEEGATCIDLTGDFQCLCPAGKTGKTCESDMSPAFVFDFSSSGSLDYATSKNLRKNLAKVTLCFWMQTTDKSNYGTAFSYATVEEDNALTLTDYSGFVFYVNGKKVVTDVTANDGRWHLICMTWDSDGGLWSIFKDGELKDTGLGLGNQTQIPGGGIAVLGQEQDQLGGGFSPAEAFLGKLYHLELWDSILPKEHIRNLYETCEYRLGNVIAWPDFKSELRGRVNIEDPSFCRGCGLPKHPSYGHIVYIHDEGEASKVAAPMTNLTYQCDVGYKLNSENPHRTCLVHGNWSGVDLHCSRVSCGFPGYVMNGNVVGNAFLFGDKVTYSCEAGYRLQGNVVRSCTSNGTWDSEPPACLQVTCSLEAIRLDHGSFSGNKSASVASIGEKIAFTCETGYKLDGPALLTCQEEGTWDDVTPTCQSIACSTPPQVENGYLIGGPVADVTAGTILRYQCDKGYSITRGSSLVCSYDGTWIGERPHCVIISCGRPDEILNGVVETSGFTYGSVASYICDDGYELMGEGDRQCSEDGIWQPVQPTCIPVQCGAPEFPEDGTVIFGEVVFGSIAIYSCYGGFQLVGPSVLRCLNTGRWSDEPPICTEIFCTQPQAIENGQILSYAPYSTGDNPVYVCNPGFRKQGNPPMCTEEGVWDHGEMRCEPLECSAPPSLENGYYVARRASVGEDESWTTPYLTGTQLTYFCNEGFSLVGSSDLACLGGYGWTNIDSLGTCEPVKCPALRNLQNGFAVLEGFDVGKTVTYQCQDGFQLDGNPKRTCLSTGSWDGSDPECNVKQCPMLSTPPDGYIKLDTNLIGSTAEYGCNPGYTLSSGSLSRQCQMDGVWSGSEPICEMVQCPLKMPKNSIFTIDGDGGPGTSVTYDCEEGYVLSGLKQIFCTEDGDWDEDEPTCEKIRCPELNPLENGKRFGNSTEAGSSVAFECNRGYEINGVHEIQCGSDGKWSHDPPTCKRVTCPHPGLIKNGKVSGLIFQFESTTEYSCHTGYELTGVKTRICQFDRTWSGFPPKCDPKKCPNIELDFGYVNYTSNIFKGVAKFSCKEGFWLSGAESVVCDANGLWSDAPPKCAQISCEIPKTQHALVTDKPYYYNDILEYSCELGFRPDDSKSVCTSSGFSKLPECLKITCPPLQQIQNGQINSTSVAFRAQVSFQCNPGFNLVGSEKAECLSSGVWSSPPPVCTELLCSVPEAIENGVVTLLESYSYGAIVKYSCNNNYFLIGKTDIECGPNGEWLDELPSCERIQCPRLPSLKNGYFDPSKTSAGDKVEFNCSPGYSLYGNSNVFCQNNSEWSGVIPECRIECKVELLDTNVLYNKKIVEVKEKVVFTCPEAYRLAGASELLCEDGGVWNSPYPHCELIQCQQPSGIDNGHFSGNTQVGNLVTYSCDNGYVLVGNSTRTCLPTGNWSGEDPNCELVLCPDLKGFDNGEVLVSGVKFGDTVRYICDSGFYLIGSNERICTEGGEWGGAEPSCEPVLCQTPAMPKHASVEFDNLEPGSVVKFSCQDSYILRGESILTCLPNGEWSDAEPSCALIICPTLNQPAGGKVEVSEVVIGSSAIYTCDDQRILHGSQKRFCLPSGEWSGFAPTCELLQCPSITSPWLIANSTSTTVGSVLELLCMEGYELSPKGASIVKCVEGVWEPEPPSCVPVDCGKPERPDNGSYMKLEQTHFGAEVVYYCHEGFKLQGSAKSSCNAHGNWNAPPPTCLPVTCPEPPNVQHATFVYATSRRHSYGSVVLYSCLQGFRTGNSGSFLFVCEGDGEWVGTPPTCLQPCREIESPANGWLRVHGDVAQYGCDAGYDILGTSTRNCTEFGNWTENEPQCQRKWCPEPQPPPEGYIMGVGRQYGDIIRYVCPLDTILEGEDMALCNEEGTWSNPTPLCSRKECGRPLTSNGAHIKGESFGIGDRVVVSCPSGYRPIDGPVITCNETGHWSGLASCGAYCERPCQNGGLCVGRGRCSCPPGFVGDRCQHAQCIMPCLNGGTCIGPYRCACKPGYTGSRCEKPICDVPCQNGGRCVAANQCSCPLGFLKPDCTKKMAVDRHRSIQPAFRSLDRFAISRRIRQQWP